MKYLMILFFVNLSFGENLLRPFKWDGVSVDSYSIIKNNNVTYESICRDFLECKDINFLKKINQKEKLSKGDIFYFPSDFLKKSKTQKLVEFNKSLDIENKYLKMDDSRMPASILE